MYKYLYAKVKLLTPFFPFPLLQKVKYLKVQYISRSKAQLTEAWRPRIHTMQCLPKRKSRTPKSWNENQRSTMELDPSTRRACHWPLEWYVFSKCLICCSLVNPLFNYEDIKLLVEINMQSMLHATWENVFFWIINAELQFSQNKVVHNIRMWLDNIEAW